MTEPHVLNQLRKDGEVVIDGVGRIALVAGRPGAFFRDPRTKQIVQRTAVGSTSFTPSRALLVLTEGQEPTRVSESTFDGMVEAYAAGRNPNAVTPDDVLRWLERGGRKRQVPGRPKDGAPPLLSALLAHREVATLGLGVPRFEVVDEEEVLRDSSGSGWHVWSDDTLAFHSGNAALDDKESAHEEGHDGFLPIGSALAAFLMDQEIRMRVGPTGYLSSAAFRLLTDALAALVPNAAAIFTPLPF
jgi:hypothetical protein